MWVCVDAGVPPNVRTYTTLMSACTRAGKWQHALEAFTEMEEAGIAPDVAAFNSGISACAAAGAWDRGWAIFGGEPTHSMCFFMVTLLRTHPDESLP